MKAKRDGELATFAHYDLSSGEICVYVKDRHIGDIMRSVAHELKHVEQHLKGVLNADSGNDGSPHENEANSFAGIMMRKFGKDFPEIYENYNSDKVVINEDVKTIDNFYAENNINPDDLSYLGSGDFGKAYSIGDGRVLKKTSSKNEFNLAKQMEGKDIPVLNSIAKIYKTDIINNQMLIILEELEEDSHIEDLYYELQNYLDEQGLSIQYIDYLDTDEMEISDELQAFMNDLDDIIRAYRYLGVEASDIRPENMGYSKDGKLKAFDIDDKQR